MFVSFGVFDLSPALSKGEGVAGSAILKFSNWFYNTAFGHYICDIQGITKK
jgi:hypothetical protein